MTIWNGPPMDTDPTTFAREFPTGPHHDIPENDQPAELSPTEAVRLLTEKMDAFMERAEARDLAAQEREARIERYVASMAERDDATIKEREEWRKAQQTADDALDRVKALERKFQQHIAGGHGG
jgi:uncharacterized protein (DUF3084 family)